MLALVVSVLTLSAERRPAVRVAGHHGSDVPLVRASLRVVRVNTHHCVVCALLRSALGTGPASTRVACTAYTPRPSMLRIDSREIAHRAISLTSCNSAPRCYTPVNQSCCRRIGRRRLHALACVQLVVALESAPLIHRRHCRVGSGLARCWRNARVGGGGGLATAHAYAVFSTTHSLRYAHALPCSATKTRLHAS